MSYMAGKIAKAGKNVEMSVVVVVVVMVGWSEQKKQTKKVVVVVGVPSASLKK